MRTRIIAALLALSTGPAFAQVAAPPAPVATTTDAQTALATELGRKLEQRIGVLASNLDGVMGYAVVDLTTGQRFGRFEAEAFPTASTIKLAIVYELFKQVDERRVSLSQVITLDRAKAVGGSGVLFEMGTPALSVSDYATLMVVLSDNTATNVLIDLVGMENVTRRMASLGLPGTKLRRHMIDIAAAKRGDENVSTPGELARLLELFYRGEGLSPASRDAALALLKKPKESSLRRGVPDGVEVANKPGELEGVRVDAGIVWVKNRPYILSVMTTYLKQDADGARAIEDASREAYEHFARLGAGLQYGRQIGR